VHDDLSDAWTFRMSGAAEVLQTVKKLGAEKRVLVSDDEFRSIVG
jgi:hypothetical protein